MSIGMLSFVFPDFCVFGSCARIVSLQLFVRLPVFVAILFCLYFGCLTIASSEFTLDRDTSILVSCPQLINPWKFSYALLRRIERWLVLRVC